ncbi:hypothetical protein DYB31_013432, partial [Aphanomyces astaci]
VPYAGNVAVATTCLGVVPYLLEHAPVACMPRLDALIRSLVSVAPPAVVAKLSMRLLLSEFSIFKDQTATVLLSSLHWNSWEQWGVWELLSAEWQAKHHDKATVAALRKVLACLDPQTHGEALSGILRLLLQICPDMALLQCVLKLSDAFDPFPSSVLAIWSDKWLSSVQPLVVGLLHDTKDAAVDVRRQLSKLPANALLLQEPYVRAALLAESIPGQLSGSASCPETAIDEPLMKKPKVDG